MRAAADAERARAEKYYAEALASLARRQASAAPDRRALLAARADGVRAEEKRRLAEIDEKYTPRYEIRPYRLHLLHVPALRIPVDVLRGARRFPLVLEWLLPAAAFAPPRCPSCGANARTWPLVAAKTHLGCARCLSRGAVSPPPVPRASSVPAPAFAVPARANGEGNGPAHGSAAGAAGAAAGAAGAAATSGRGRVKAAGGTVPAKRRPAASRPASAASRRVSTAAGPKPPSPQAVSKTGGKLALEFWSVTGQGNLRALRRLCAPDSPAAAAVRLYGIQGPTTAIGMVAGDRPESLTSITSVPHPSELAGTCGFLDAGRDRYNYLLRWDPCTRLVAEVLPFGSWVSARLPSARWLPAHASERLFGGLPEPDCDLDPVAVRLWRKVLPAHGLPLALRCLAAWWRISDRPEFPAGPRPSVLAAAIHRMIGYRAGEAGVTHDAIAELHRVKADETRAITPPLQARLQLSAQQPW